MSDDNAAERLAGILYCMEAEEEWIDWLLASPRATCSLRVLCAETASRRLLPSRDRAAAAVRQEAVVHLQRAGLAVAAVDRVKLVLMGIGDTKIFGECGIGESPRQPKFAGHAT